MKIVILNPRQDFTPKQQEQLSQHGEIVYMDPPAAQEHPMSELVDLTKDAEILGVDPDVMGGIEIAKERVNELLESLPSLKALALATTSYGWVDLSYCKKRNIRVANCPKWSREAVAEQALALLFCLAKKIIKLDRKTQKGEYKLEMGFDLKGKTLGIIGVGSIGSALANLANGIGMKVIGYNHSSRQVGGVEMKNSLEELLAESDAISIHVTHTDENAKMIGEKELSKMKDGVILVNLAARENVDENAMTAAIRSGHISGYAYESDNVEKTSLTELENVIALKPFAWYTKEALDNLFQIWVENIIAFATNKPQNLVSS